MPPKAAPSPGVEKSALSARELELMTMICQCLETEPKINVDKFAQMAGYTDRGSAANAWAAIKKKLGLNAPKKPASPTKKSFDEEDDDDTKVNTPTTAVKKRKTKGADETPSKKPRGRKPKNIKAEELEDEDAADSGATNERVTVKSEDGGEDDVD